MPRLTPPPDRTPLVPKLRLPAGAVDAHLHMFGPVSKYAFAPEASYISEDATAAMYFAMQDRLGLSRAVLVSGGGYGQTYDHLADMLAAYPDRLRGVVRLPAAVTDAELARLNRLGVKAARLFTGTMHQLGSALFDRVREIGWHLELYSGLDGLPDHADALLASGMTVVLDHFAHNAPDRGMRSEANKVLLRLLDTGRFWVKISGPMRITDEEPPYPGVVPIAQALVAHAPERLVWGTDWPHTHMWGRTIPNDAALVDMLEEWVPDEATRTRILVDNPVVLYGF